MNFVFILILPLVFLLYALFSKEQGGKFTAFLLGILGGIVSLIIVSFFPLSDLQISSSFAAHLWRFFFQYFFLHALFGLIFFLLVSFSLSEETLSNSFSAILGIFSSVFAYLFYKNINTPDSTELISFLTIIIGSILIFDFVYYILSSNLTISMDFIIYAIAFISFIVFTFLGSYSLAAWYLSVSSTMYIFISCGVLLLGVSLNIVRNRL
ncbi:hypothetical protein [Treponema putidum]|uniref:hypothetical protein n=1 Tax=Treponema putidum TaxID=221027 RepID=UPI0021058F25|nr:hypothetical protein [Treponema putidum]UTY31198.1 hypothetical protein E4N75_06420 [Treponema putidum]